MGVPAEPKSDDSMHPVHMVARLINDVLCLKDKDLVLRQLKSVSYLHLGCVVVVLKIVYSSDTSGMVLKAAMLGVTIMSAFAAAAK